MSPLPPLDPRTQKAIDEAVERAIDKVVARVVQPVVDDVSILKKVDQRHDERLTGHSDTHRNLAEDVKAKLAAGREATTADVARMLTEFRAELKSTPAAAVGALTAANNASQHAASAAIDTEQIRSKQRSEAHSARIKFWITIIPVVATAIATIVQAFR